MGPALTILVGNPRPGSRTRAAALEVGERLALEVGGTVRHVTDLGELGPAVLDPDSEAADLELREVAATELLVVASPTYKATFTGLLKSFFDRYQGPGLAGVVAVGMMVAGNAEHALAGEVHLRPLLVELGAVVPARNLFLLDSELEGVGETFELWAETARAPIRAALEV